jgi:hypothetical protein
MRKFIRNDLRQFFPPESESDLQARCVAWFDKKYPGCTQLLFAIPNGGHRSKATAGILKSEGVRRGVADLFLAIPIMGMAGMFIEMKFKKGKQSAEQLGFQKQVEGVGYKYVVCASETDFQETITTYLS